MNFCRTRAHKLYVDIIYNIIYNQTQKCILLPELRMQTLKQKY
jgi:hypothetical protein